MRMRMIVALLLVSGLVAAATVGYADTVVVDCSKKSLADAVREATDKTPIITFTGICQGPVVVSIDGLTLKGIGTAIIDGDGTDALTLAGVSRVSLIDFEVTNGLTGVLVRDGSHVSFTAVNSHHNALAGVSIHTASSALLTDVIVANNGGTGVAVDDGVSVTVTNSTFTGNVVRDLRLTFGSRITVQNLVAGTYTCDSTVLVRGTSLSCPQ